MDGREKVLRKYYKSLEKEERRGYSRTFVLVRVLWSTMSVWFSPGKKLTSQIKCHIGMPQEG